MAIDPVIIGPVSKESDSLQKLPLVVQESNQIFQNASSLAYQNTTHLKVGIRESLHKHAVLLLQPFEKLTS